MKAVIMAGGEGTRLRPLTCNRPKPMVPVGNRPIMHYAVDMARKLGLGNVAVTLQYLPEAIRGFFGSGQDYGLNLHYFVEKDPLGTAGSVKNASSFLDETFIVMSGDALTDFNLHDAIRFHQTTGALATLVLTTISNPLEYGVVLTYPDGRVRRFLEKPSWGEVFSDQVNTGIYILEPEVLDYIPPGQMFDFSKDLFPLLLAKGCPLYAVSLPGYWCDVGSLDQYSAAHWDLLEGKMAFYPPGRRCEDGVYVGERSVVDPRARLVPPVLIGEDCYVEAEAVVGPYAALGNGVVVGRGATIKRTIVWDGSHIGRGAHLRGAVVAAHTIIKDYSSLLEGAVVGERSFIDERTVIKPNVKLWPGKFVDREVELGESLVWSEGFRKPLFKSGGVSGTINRELSPEFLSRLGAAFGSVMPRGTRVFLSSDAGPSLEILESALQAGLRSAGVAVVRGGKMPVGAHRFGVGYAGANYGAHITYQPGSEEGATIILTDGRGVDIGPDLVRKTEHLFFREDFRRVDPRVVPQLEEQEIFPAYSRYLLEGVAVPAVRHRFRTVSIGAPLPLYVVWAEEVFRRMDVSTREVVAPGPDAMREKIDLGQLAFYVELGGEGLIIWDENGNMYRDMEVANLLTFLCLNDAKALVLPLGGGRAMELLAGRHQVEIIRSKNGKHFYMDACARVADRQGRYKQYPLLFDAIAAMVKICDYLARYNTMLSETFFLIPRLYTTYERVYCPQSLKGEVMRVLAESMGGVELVDGLRISNGDGNAFIFPDSDGPSYWVGAESSSPETAAQMCSLHGGMVRRLIENLQAQELKTE